MPCAVRVDAFEEVDETEFERSMLYMFFVLFYLSSAVYEDKETASLVLCLN